MTLNIWNMSGPWRQRREEIVAWLRFLDPDVVCLQEVLDSPGGMNQARWLAEHAGLGHNVVYGAGGEVNGHAFGNAVLTRWDVEGEEVLPLPRSEAPDDVARVALHVRTHGIDVFTTHLAWRLDDSAVRQLQARAVADFVQERSRPGSPAVLAGDMNADPSADEVRYLTGRTAIDGSSVCFLDAWETGGGGGAGNTWDNRNPFAVTEREPDRRIDYILLLWRAHAGAWFRHARLVCDRSLTGTYASDHIGVLAELVVPDPRPAEGLG